MSSDKVSGNNKGFITKVVTDARTISSTASKVTNFLETIKILAQTVSPYFFVLLGHSRQIPTNRGIELWDGVEPAQRRPVQSGIAGDVHTPPLPNGNAVAPNWRSTWAAQADALPSDHATLSSSTCWRNVVGDKVKTGTLCTPAASNSLAISVFHWLTEYVPLGTTMLTASPPMVHDSVVSVRKL